MTINITKYRSQLVTAMHLLFWILSINVWNIVFNPGVESTGIINGVQDYWAALMLLNFIFYFFCLLPFVWALPKARKWLKISATVLFFLPIIYLVYEKFLPAAKRDDVSGFTDYFIAGFLYAVVFHLTIAGAVYFNLRVLVNRYLKMSKFGHYIWSVFVLILLSAIINYALFNWVIDKIFPSLYFISYFEVWELIVIVFGYLFFTTIVLLIWQYAGMLIANRDKAQHELFALKAQINPHFLFNNLNTIYSMATNNDLKTKEVILQLSDFLRYVLYDTASEFIPLEKEVEIIRTYVELQKARIDPEIMAVNLTVEGDFGDTRITPLLLLPLAENCFKHGIGKGPGSIDLYIGLEGKRLHFVTSNAVAIRERNSEGENGGIGINNVEKRLNLLYPDRHALEYVEKEGLWKLEMFIELG
ncbi:MAG: histidine kinase [Prolixibacteraceae bacterium]